MSLEERSIPEQYRKSFEHRARTSAVDYPDPKTGQPIKVLHPEVAGIDGRARRNFEPNEVVTVELPDRSVRAAFVDYLGMNGVNFQEYLKAFQTGKSNKEILKALHSAAIGQRIKEAMEYNKTRPLREYEEQQTARKEIEAFAVNMINESGYGEAKEGEPQSDHYEKIDFFIKLDPQELGLSGEPAYFGIQHTALGLRKAEKLQHKEAAIKSRPQVFIPEHPEYGAVTRIFIHEDREDFFPENDNRSYDYILSKIKNEEKRKPRVWEAFTRNADGKLTGVSPAEARVILMQRVQRIYEQIDATLTEYLAGVAPERFKKDLETKKLLTAKLLETMKAEALV